MVLDIRLWRICSTRKVCCIKYITTRCFDSKSSCSILQQNVIFTCYYLIVSNGCFFQCILLLYVLLRRVCRHVNSLYSLYKLYWIFVHLRRFLRFCITLKENVTNHCLFSGFFLSFIERNQLTNWNYFYFCLIIRLFSIYHVLENKCISLICT